MRPVHAPALLEHRQMTTRGSGEWQSTLDYRLTPLGNLSLLYSPAGVDPREVLPSIKIGRMLHGCVQMETF